MSSYILRSVDRSSLYNLVNETNVLHNLFLVYFVNFIYNLYMFRTSPCPSSGAYAPAYQTAIKNNKYQVSQKYSSSSWWWTWRGPEHVQVINKIDEIR